MLSEQDLIDYLEDTLSPADRARVVAELERDPEARRKLRQQTQLDAALRVALQAAPANERVKQSVLAVVRGESEAAIKQHVLADTTFTARVRPGGLSFWLAAIFNRPARAFGFAAVCLGIIFGSWLALRPGPKSQPLAQTIETPIRVEYPTGAMILPGGGREIRHNGSAGTFTPEAGDGLRVGTSNSATIRFADGTVLHLEPGAEVIFQSVANPPRAGGKQIKLISGSLTADVAKQPAGLPLLIQTPHALLTVVGTEFDLTVATNQTELAVTHGLVKLAAVNAASPVSVAAGEFAVAAPNAAPRYGRLPRNPYLWPFSSASPWNKPIGKDAGYEPLPGRPFLADGPLKDAVRSRRPFLGRATDPLRNLWVNGERRADIRFADPGSLPLGKMESVVLLQHSRRYALEVRGLILRPDGDLEVEDMERTSLAGGGMDAFVVPARPYGLSQLGGLIRTGEYEHGIPHALAARINRERLGGRVDFSQPSTVWPATGRVEPSGQFLSVGTLLAIPPDVDIRQVVGDSGPGYELARAMQDYGVYITGFIDAPFVLLTGEARLAPQTEDALLNQLVPLLKVVANNSPSTPGGGGTPRRGPAPAFPGETE